MSHPHLQNKCYFKKIYFSKQTNEKTPNFKIQTITTNTAKSKKICFLTNKTFKFLTTQKQNNKEKCTPKIFP